MSQGYCQVDKKIGTAPAHNPNQEYHWIADDEPMVFCEDEQCKMPISDCRQIGELWYSNNFIDSFTDQFEAIDYELQQLGSLQADFFADGRFDDKKAKYYLSIMGLSLKRFRKQFETIGVEADND